MRERTKTGEHGVKQAILERDVKDVRVIFICKTEYDAIRFHDTIERTMRDGYLDLDWLVMRVRIEGNDP